MFFTGNTRFWGDEVRDVARRNREASFRRRELETRCFGVRHVDHHPQQRRREHLPLRVGLE
jgi:hypothetical protein